MNIDRDPISHEREEEDAVSSRCAAAEPRAAAGAPCKPATDSGRTPRFRWGLVLSACALVALAVLVDQAVTAWLTEDAVYRWVNRVIKVPLDAGALIAALAILASFPNRKRLWVGFLTPVLLHIPVLHLLKWAIGRARPKLELGALHFEPFSGADYCDAFPSGHAMSALIFALLLGIYFPRARWVFYVLPALVGVERIITSWHFLSDVLAGYVLAGLIVYASLRVLGPRFYSKDLTPLPLRSGPPHRPGSGS